VQRLALRLAVAIVFGMWSMGALILYVQPDIASPCRLVDRALASGLFALPVLAYSGAAIFRMAGARSGCVRQSRPADRDRRERGGALDRFARSRGSAGLFDTAMLVTLLLLGRLIETRVRRTAIQALSAVDDLAANQAVALADGGSVELRQLAIGASIMIDAGAVIPGDGVVVEGESLIDRSIMTGEAMASAIGPDDRVQAGNDEPRRLMVRVDRAYGDRDIDRMGGRIALEIAGRGEPRRALDQWIARLLAAAPAWSALAFLIAFALGASLVKAMTRALATLIVICLRAGDRRTARVCSSRRRCGTTRIRIADPAALEALAGMRTAILTRPER
jgi:cation transport ATPase